MVEIPGMMVGTEDQQIKKRLIYSIVIILLLLLLPWGVQIFQWTAGHSLIPYGLRPWRLYGLMGIITMPFLHQGFNHLMSNSIPLLVLGSGLFYFYRESAWKFILWMMVMSGLILWFIGKADSNHIGASGLVYSLVSFHLTSGVIRRNRHLMAFALLVVFLYGGFIWSLFPDFFPDRNISWEGHLAGLIAGIVTALLFRREGPQTDRVILEDEETDDEDNNREDHWESPNEQGEGSNPHSSGNVSTTLSEGRPFRYLST